MVEIMRAQLVLLGILTAAVLIVVVSTVARDPVPSATPEAPRSGTGDAREMPEQADSGDRAGAGGLPHQVEVVDTEDRPIEGAEVLAYRCQETPEEVSWSFELGTVPPAIHRALTDAAGRATLPPLGDDS